MHLAVHKYAAFALFLMITPATHFAHAGEVHKWTDENGRVHYGGRPPEGIDSEAVVVSKAEPIDRNKIIGTWVERDKKTRAVMHISYRDDGSFVGSTIEEGWGKIVFYGKWSLEGNRMNFRFERSEPTMPADFYKPRLMTIARVTETELVDGRGGRMERVGGD